MGDVLYLDDAISLNREASMPILLLFLHGVLQAYSYYSESVTLLPLELLMVLEKCVE